MSNGFVIIGVGGFGREVLDVFDTSLPMGVSDPGIEFLGFTTTVRPDLDVGCAWGANRGSEVLSTLPAGTYYAVHRRRYGPQEDVPPGGGSGL